MSQQTQLSQLAKHLANLINEEITSSPLSPALIIKTLKFLVSDANEFLSQLHEIPQEQQWHQIISFIEQYILDQSLLFSNNIATHQIMQIYHILIQIIEQTIRNSQSESQCPSDRQVQDENNSENKKHHHQHPFDHQNQQLDNSHQQNLNPTPSELSEQILHEHLPKNQSQLNYIQSLKKQHQTHKQHPSKSHQIKNNNNRSINSKNPIKKPQIQLKRSNIATNQQNQLKKRLQKSSNQRTQQKIKSNKFDHKEYKKQTKSQQATKKIKSKTAGSSKDKKGKIPLQNSQKLKQKQFILSQSMDQQFDEPFESIAIQAVKQVLQNRKKIKKNNLKTNIMMRDNVSKEIIEKAMRTYKYGLMNKRKEEKVISKKHQATKSVSNDNQMRSLKYKQKQMESEIINEQLKHYHQLRDKKLKFINHMHQLIQKLQKERYVNLQKQQKQEGEKQKQKIKLKIKQADHLFQDNMKMIKQNYKNHRLAQNVQKQAQIKILKSVQKSVKQNKQNQINLIKCLWEEEKRKLDLIKKDEENIKQKLEGIYRKTKI